jgi:ABC-2 type transport system ATP-binding protein
VTDPPPPLEIRGLTRRYGALVAVDRLSLTLRPGEILGFLGPNGAGKTTTLRACAGLLRPDAGDVVVAGHSLRDQPMRARAALGFVPDRPFLYERLSAREFLDLIGALYDVPAATAAARADALLARLELDTVADDLIETYSLGMRQKVSLAAAVLHDPALLMLDEPLVGLDPIGVRAFKDLLREHTARGGGAFVSTHLLEVAERLCDRVAILHRGRLRAEGSLAELRGSQSAATLEDVFLELTRSGTAPEPGHTPEGPPA